MKTGQDAFESIMRVHRLAVHQLGAVREHGRTTSYSRARWLEIADLWETAGYVCLLYGESELGERAVLLSRGIREDVVKETLWQKRRETISRA